VLIRKVLPSHVQTFLCKYSFGASSYNAYLAVLRAMFNLAVSDALIAESPVRNLKERRREKPIRPTPTWDQFQSIVANVREQKLKGMLKTAQIFWSSLG
jgi:integrase